MGEEKGNEGKKGEVVAAQTTKVDGPMSQFHTRKQTIL